MTSSGQSANATSANAVQKTAALRLSGHRLIPCRRRRRRRRCRPSPANMHPPSPLFLHIFLLLPAFTAAAAAGGGGGSSNGNATVFEVLPQYGLPEGLLPDAVASYSLDTDGRFVVELERPFCYVRFGSYLVYYEQRIKGSLKIGSIRGLEGIQVQRLFLWLGVDEIKVDLPPTDYIYFQVGWITKRLPIDEFRTVHPCGDRATYRSRIKGLFPEPLYEIRELITGDVHVALQK